MEIDPTVLEAAPYLAASHHGVLSHPRFNLIAEDVRTRVARHPIIFDAAEIWLTASIGAAPYVADQLLRAALSAADLNLFRAKERGRNIVIFDLSTPDLEDQAEHIDAA